MSRLAFVLALLSASTAGAAGFDAHRLWTAHGTEAGALFGSAVTSGDVNGDGLRDVIVGASHATTSAGLPDGKVFAYYATLGGLPDTPSWSAEGEHGQHASAMFGATLASADLNGDGFDDVVVGSWRFDLPNEGHSQGGGRVYVYYGSATGLPPAPSFVVDGYQYDQGVVSGLGYTLAVGDFNGDGIADLAASNYARYVGSVFVHYGSTSGLSEKNSWRFLGSTFTQYLGASVSAGDFDGDGFDDLIVMNQPDQEFATSWAAVIYRGSPAGFPPPTTPPSAPDPWLLRPGWTTAASVGDVDGDGYDDILASELPFDACLCDSPTYVLHRGSSRGPHRRPQRLVRTLEEGFPVVQPIGDLNGDGFADAIAVEGHVYVVHFGSAAGFDPHANGTGPVPAGPFVGAGDVNGDGVSDLLVGDSANERADLYEGAADWSFTAAADLSIEQEAYEGYGFEMVVRNAGPDPVRMRLFDPVPSAFSPPSWYCIREPIGPGSGATANCLNSGGFQGEIDSLITIAPGGAIRYSFAAGALSLPVVNTAYLVLPEWVVDPDLSNNQTTAVLGPPPVHLLFRDDFESGDLSAWSSRGGRGVRVTHDASLQGAFGLQATLRGSRSATVQDDSPEGESDYRAHFLFDPQEFGAPGVEGTAILFTGHGGAASVPLFDVRIRSRGATLVLSASARLDDGSVRETGGVPITTARHLLELAWRRSSGTAASDGQLELRLDGADAALLEGLDNDGGGGVDSVTLGLAPVGAVPAGSQRTVRLDGFVSWRPE